MATSRIPPVNHYSSQNTLIAQPVTRSKVLTGLGIAEVVFSIFLFSSCIWSASVRNTTVTSYLGFFCAIYHAILGLFAIVGGINVNKYRNYVIATLILWIIGTCILTISVLISDIMEWSDWSERCLKCPFRYTNYYINNQKSNIQYHKCPKYCYVDENIIFIPILVFLILETIVAVVLSSTAFCHLYCRHQPPPQMSSHQSTPQSPPQMSSHTNPQVNVPISNYMGVPTSGSSFVYMPTSDPSFMYMPTSEPRYMPTLELRYMPTSELQQQYTQLYPRLHNPTPNTNVIDDQVSGW